MIADHGFGHLIKLEGCYTRLNHPGDLRQGFRNKQRTFSDELYFFFCLVIDHTVELCLHGCRH